MSSDFVSRYRILEEIGRGGMGIVYRAEDPRLERLVAIKVLPPKYVKNQEVLHRFLREAKVAAKLDHPNIIPVFDVGEDQGTFFMVMEYIEGKTLREWLETRKALDFNQSCSFFRQIAKALEYAHKRKVIHRDIKPENVILLSDQTLKVTDFGIAVMQDRHSVTQPGAVLGTIAYISPEQAQGKPADTRSDIYSLGVLFFEFLTGRLPFQAETPSQLLSHHLFTPPPLPSMLNPTLSSELDRLVYKTLLKNPEERYQTVSELLQDLEKAISRKESPAEFLGTPAQKESLQPPPSVEEQEKSKILKELDALLSKETAAETPEQLLKEPTVKLDLSYDSFADYRSGTQQEPVEMEKEAAEVIPIRDFLEESLAEKLSLPIPCVWCGAANSDAVSACSYCGALLAEFPPEWESTMEPGLSFYFEKKYKEADTFFQKLIAKDSQMTHAHFYLGLCRFQTKEFHEALTAFRKEVEIFPALGAAWEGLGDTAVLLSLENDAEEAYQEALRLSPTPVLWLKLAKIQENRNHLQEAERSLENAKQLAPYHREVLLKSAEISLKQSQYEETQSLLQQLLELNPNDPQAHRLLGQLYERTDHYGQALQAYEKALSIQPDDSHLHTLLGELHARQNQTEQAIVQFKKAVKEQHSGNAETFAKLGDLYLKKKQETSALAYFEKAVELGQNNPSFHKKLGKLHWKRSDWEKALIQLEWTIALDPTDSEAHRLLGQIYSQRKETALSLREYKKAIQLEPYNPELHESLGMVHYAREEYLEAAEAMQRAVMLDPDNGEYRKALGVMYESKGKLESARKEYQKAIEINPRDALAQGLLGRIYLQQDLIHLAFYQFQKSLALNPKSRLVQSLLGKTYLQLAQFKNAAAAFRNALELTKKSSHPRAKQILGKTYYYLGQSLMELKQYNEAEEALNRAVELLPNFARAFQWLGRSALRMGETEKGMQLLLQAVLLAPDDLEIFAELLEILEETKDWDGAIRFFSQRLQVEPAKSKLHALLGELYLRKDDLEEAVLCYEKALQQEERFQDIYHNKLGELCMTKKLFSDAAAHFELAAKVSPQNWRYHQALAGAYKAMGKKGKALTELEKAKKIALNLNQDSFSG